MKTGCIGCWRSMVTGTAVAHAAGHASGGSMGDREREGPLTATV